MAEVKKTSKKLTKAEPKAKPAEVNEPKKPQGVEVNETAKAEKVEKVTKAGKHSPKALKEAAEKEAKEVRKATKSIETVDAKKPAQKPARSKLERAGKKFREAAKLVEKGKEYSLQEAVELAIKTSPTKFDATVELHVNLGVDPKQADQNIRDNVVLPAGSGKTLRVAVLAEAEEAAAAKKAGADIVGHEDLLKEIEKGVLAFDTLISTPNLMAKLGKHARVLGPKGLMPNPKSGTVTNDVAKAVTQAKAGRVEYRVDSTGIVHLGIGKVSFGGDKLIQNLQAILASIKANKPASLKGFYVKKITVTTTMGPGIKVATSEV